MSVTVRAQLEQLAREMWDLQADVWRFGVRYGEESLTDWLMLRVAAQRSAGWGSLNVHPVSRRVEAATGVDWLWKVPGRQPAWLAVQAKKLDVASGRYVALSHHAGGSFRNQIDILDEFSTRHGFDATYCLFNWQRPTAGALPWSCTDTRDDKQLGISSAPIDVIRWALDTRGKRTFIAIHSDARVKPWRCLVPPPPPKNPGGGPASPAPEPPDYEPMARESSQGHSTLIEHLETALAGLDPGQPVPDQVLEGLEPAERPRYIVA